MEWSVEMEKAKLEEMFSNGDAVLRTDIERDVDCYPNQIWQVNKRWFVLVCNQSQGLTFQLVSAD